MRARLQLRKPIFVVTIAMVLVIAIAACSGSTPNDQSEQLVAAVPDSSGAIGSSFALHGDWVIDIANPDGTLASHHAVENTLAQIEAQRIALLLSKSNTPGTWRILLGEFNSGAYSPCLSTNGLGMYQCFLSEPSASSTPTSDQLSTNSSANLIVTPPTTPTSGSFVLSGSITARRDAQISQVETQLGLCSPNISPDDCSQVGSSADILAENINVVAGQAILVTVTLTVAP
jgi:hypothetical protein